MAPPIPVWIINGCQFFLEKPIAIFQRHLMCILFSQHTILKHSLIRTTNLPFTYALLQPCILSSSFKDCCLPFPTLSSKSVPKQQGQFRHLSSLLPPRSFEFLMKIKVLLLLHESLEKWRGRSFLLWLCFDSKQTTPILWGLLFQSSVYYLSYTM